MNHTDGHDFDQDLARALAQGRSVSSPGFAERAVRAIQADRRQRRLVRWGSALTTAAACLLAAFVIQGGDDALAQRARALAASDESSQLSDILGFADELAMLTPVVDRHTVVEALINPEL